jgi:hypothetical protein
MEVECVFSEKRTPISELVKGTPDRPLREPALVLLACLFNVFQIYQLSVSLTQTPIVDPWMVDYWLIMVMGTVTALIGWYVAFSIILLIGAGVVYFLNRRAGGAVILVISIIGLLVGFVSISMGFMLGMNAMRIITGFLSPIFGLIAGINGVRAEKPPMTHDAQEII